MEILKNIDKYPNYSVSNLGYIKNNLTNKILKLNLINGYYGVIVKPYGKYGKSVCLKLHRLLAIEFIPNQYNLPQVNHIDGDKLNNSLSNLEWVTPKQNVNHAIELGLLKYKSGQNHHAVKLSTQQIVDIRSLYESGVSQRKIAKMFNVGKTTIHDIVNRLRHTT